MKKIHIFSIVYLLAFILSLNNNGYAKDVSEKDVIKIEKEAQQKELESKNYENYQYKLVVCHIPLVFVNSRKNHKEELSKKYLDRKNNLGDDDEYTIISLRTKPLTISIP